MNNPHLDSPILEVAELSIRPGMETAFEAAMAAARPLISATEGFLGMDVRRCLERPSVYLLLVWWQTVDAHEIGFRKSDRYAQWRAALHHFYDPFPTVEHFQSLSAASATP